METLTIVMFSGGIDSTALLYKMLTQTDDTIVAHHIEFVNREQRHVVERQAAKNVAGWLIDHTRPFEVSASAFALPYPNFGWDIINAMYIGGIIVKNYRKNERIVRLCIGDNKDDFAPRKYNGKSLVAQMMGILASLDDPMVEVQSPPVIINPVIKQTKKELMDSLPPELLALTWSCRTPKYSKDMKSAETCGQCITCEDLKDLGLYVPKTIVLSP